MAKIKSYKEEHNVELLSEMDFDFQYLESEFNRLTVTEGWSAEDAMKVLFPEEIHLLNSNKNY